MRSCCTLPMLLLALAGCAGAPPSAAPSATMTPPEAPDAGSVAAPSDAGPAGDAAAASAGGHAALSWMENDVPGAIDKAKREGKLVFVDTWAEWCHTCISMRHFVLDSPALRPLGDSVVFVSVDTERDQNAAFVDKYAIDVWPTFFVLDPDKGDVLGYWPGAASIREMDAFVKEALAARDAREASKLDPKSPLALLIAAKASQAKSAYDAAAKQYAATVERAPKDWPRRGEALEGWISALFNGGHADDCIKVGTEHLDEVAGVAKPTDFARILDDCAEHTSDAARRKSARERVKARLEQVASAPDPEATPDDRSDTLGLLSSVLMELGDKAGAREVQHKRLAILEKAAKDAPSPAAASTYDFALSHAYLAAGRADDAVKLLEAREKQIPDSYEPPARLAGVLATIKRYPEALAAVNRALAHAEGPRRIDYLELKASIQAELKDYAGQLQTLQEVVAGYEKHAKRQAAKPQRLETAKRRLEEAKRTLAAAKSGH